MDPWLRLLLPVVIFLVVAPLVYRRMKKERDLQWERRWTQLPLAERWRLSRRARQGKTPADPTEAALVAGSAHYQRSVLRGTLRGTLRLIVPSVLFLVALAEGSLLLIGLTLALLGFVAWLAYRDRALDRRLARAADLGTESETERNRQEPGEVRPPLR